MLEKVGEVRYWQVFFNGELWRAVSEFFLSAGDRVVAQKVDRFRVTVIPLQEPHLAW
ncbi:MAG: NfeD family protein [Deltaproteobacteria bacterium]|nr:NfeD family protein [Deltaproteobacteria bacterium]